jgi:integrase
VHFVNPWARAAIEPLRRAGYAEIFPWRHWPASQGWLQTCRRRQLAAAGLPEARRFGFHGLRRALATWIAPQNGMLASIVLGHKTGNVAKEHYVNPEAVRDVLLRVPQPGAITQQRFSWLTEPS